MLSDQGYDGKKADVWSCGVILYVLLAGFLPFDESTIVALFAKIQAADFTYPSWFSSEVRSLLDQMLVADPHARITIANIRAHPWFHGPGGADHAADTANAATAAHAAVPPTAAQLESAFKPTGSGGAAGEEENYDDDYTSATGPVALNAFDLVSVCGGFLIDRMFSPEIFYSAPGDAAAGATTAGGAAAKSYAHLGGSILFGSNAANKGKSYHFTATNITPQALTHAVYDALAGMGFTFESDRAQCERLAIIQAQFLSAKGMVGMYVQAFTLTPALTLLEIRKGKGDILEWNNAYQELVERRIGGLINRPAVAAGGDAKSVY